MAKGQKRIVAALICVLLFPLGAPSASASSCPEKVLDRGGGFETIELPAGKSTLPTPWNEPRAYNYAVAYGNPNRIFSAGDTSLQRSDDGGCTWKEVFHIGALTGGAPTVPCDGAVRQARIAMIPGCADITDLDVGTTPETAGRVYVQVSTYWAGSSLSFPWIYGPYTTWTFVSDNGGDEFHLALDPNSPSGVELSRGTGPLYVAPSDGNTLYAFRYDQNYGAAPSLFGSRDGGKTWTKRAVQQVFLRYFTIDPHNPAEVWALGQEVGAGQQPLSAALVRSKDYGETWTQVPTPFDAADIASLTISSDKSGPSAAVHLSQAMKNYLMTPSGGWSELLSIGLAGDVRFGSSPRYLFLVDGTKFVARWDMVRKILSGLKQEVYGQYESQRVPTHVPGAGLYFLTGCYQTDVGVFIDVSCSLLARYKGRGT